MSTIAVSSRVSVSVSHPNNGFAAQRTPGLRQSVSTTLTPTAPIGAKSLPIEKALAVAIKDAQLSGAFTVKQAHSIVGGELSERQIYRKINLEYPWALPELLCMIRLAFTNAPNAVTEFLLPEGATVLTESVPVSNIDASLLDITEEVVEIRRDMRLHKRQQAVLAMRRVVNNIGGLFRTIGGKKCAQN